MTSRRSGRKTRVLKGLVLVFVTVCILSFLVRDVGILTVFHRICEAKPRQLGFACLLSLGFVCLSGLRWQILLDMMGYRVDLWRCQKITLATYVANSFVPSKGGDLFKGWALKDTVPVSRGVGVVIAERVIDLGILCSMALVGSILANRGDVAAVSVVFVCFCGLGVFLLQRLGRFDFQGRFGQHIKDLGFAARRLVGDLSGALVVLTIGLAIWIGSGLQIFVLYSAVGDGVPFLFTMQVVPLVIFVGLLPLTVAGMGTREAALIFFFSNYATDSESIAVGLLFAVLRYWLIALLGIPFVGYLKGDGPEKIV